MLLLKCKEGSCLCKGCIESLNYLHSSSRDKGSDMLLQKEIAVELDWLHKKCK